jgi:hypothetical protein
VLLQLQDYLLAQWSHLPGAGPKPRRLSFLGQATGVSKVCFFVFAEDERLPRYIVKTPRSPVDDDGLRQEVSTITGLRESLPETLRSTLPGPIHLTRLAGQLVAIEPVLAGRPLDSLMSPEQPLERTIIETQMALAQQWLIQIQRAAPQRIGALDSAALRQHFIEPLEAARGHAALSAAEERYLDQLIRSAHALEGSSTMPLYLYHGDFRPGNILVADGDRIAVLDWQFSRPFAPPLLDWFSFVFRLYSRAVNLPDIDGNLEAYREAFQHVFFRPNEFSALVVNYTRAYGQALGVDEGHLPLLFGLFVVNNINHFHDFLARRARRGYLYLLRNAPNSHLSYQQQIRRQAYVWLLGDLALRPDALVLTTSSLSVRSSDKPGQSRDAPPERLYEAGALMPHHN